MRKPESPKSAGKSARKRAGKKGTAVEQDQKGYPQKGYP